MAFQTSLIKKSVIKWAGGKSKILEKIHDAIPDDTFTQRLVDVFAGSGVVGANAKLLGQFENVWMNDINPDLTNLYRCLQSSSDLVLAEAAYLFEDSKCNGDSYQELRAEFNAKVGSNVRRAALFLYFNKHTFNGLCRYNASGKFNASYGHRDKPPILDAAGIRTFSDAIAGARVTTLDFEVVLEQCGKGDLVYCDPPYSPLNGQSTNFTAYTADEFGSMHHTMLVDAAMAATERGATVLISNHSTIDTHRLYAGGQIITFPVQRFINRNGRKRQRVEELIAIYRPKVSSKLKHRSRKKLLSSVRIGSGVRPQS